MSPITIVVLCIQACLIQNAFSACLGPALAGPANGGYGLAGSYGMAGSAGRAGCAGPAYGGNGVGNVAIAGELPVSGTTTMAGQVPIIGSVQFRGPVCASGSVTIAGSSCSCGSPYGIY